MFGCAPTGSSSSHRGCVRGCSARPASSPGPGADRRSRRGGPSLGGGFRTMGDSPSRCLPHHSRPRRLGGPRRGCAPVGRWTGRAVRRQCRFAWGLERREPHVLHLSSPPTGVRPSATASGSLAAGTSRNGFTRRHGRTGRRRAQRPRGAGARPGGPGARPRGTRVPAAADLRGQTERSTGVPSGPAARRPPARVLGRRRRRRRVGGGDPYIRDVERAHGLPTATRQAVLGQDRRCDNLFEAQQLVLEVDGRLGHEGWAGRVRDGVRDRAAAREGRLTARVFWTDVAVTPCALADEVGVLLRSARLDRLGAGLPPAGLRCRPLGCGLTRCRVHLKGS